MQQIDTLKKTLIEALKNSNFQVEIDGPNNVSLCDKYDGSQYLLVRGDTERFGVDCGSCTVTILDHTFVCEFMYGEWSANDEDGEQLLEDEEFVDALESAEGVISGEQSDLDGQAMVYCLVNDIQDDLPVYWCKETDIPKDIDRLDWYDPVSCDVLVTLSNGETENVKCDLPCEGIYDLYCRLKENDMLFKAPTVSSEFIKEEVPDLYENIIDEIQFDSRIDDTDITGFSLENTERFFDYILG